MIGRSPFWPARGESVVQDLTKLENILDRAGEHLKALRRVLAGERDFGLGVVDDSTRTESPATSGMDVKSATQGADGASRVAVSGWEELQHPDLSDASSTAEAIQRCLAVLVQERGTAILADTKGFLLAGVGPADEQESLAAVGALAAQMAFRAGDFLEALDPRTLVVAGTGDLFVGATFFPVEDDHLVLVLSGPGVLHRAGLVRRVFEWIRPLLASESALGPNISDAGA